MKIQLCCYSIQTRGKKEISKYIEDLSDTIHLEVMNIQSFLLNNCRIKYFFLVNMENLPRYSAQQNRLIKYENNKKITNYVKRIKQDLACKGSGGHRRLLPNHHSNHRQGKTEFQLEVIRSLWRGMERQKQTVRDEKGPKQDQNPALRVTTLGPIQN